MFVLIIDYGSGNIKSVYNSIKKTLHNFDGLSEVKVSRKLSEIKKTDCEEALKNCNSKDKKNCNPKNYPAYPQKSWNIFNAIVVLFQNIAEIFLGRKKNRRIGRSRIGRSRIGRSRGRGRRRGRSF